MKKLKPILILLFVLFTSLKGIGQSLTYTFIDPCTKDVTYFSIPIQSGGGTTIFFLGQQRYFTANDVASGALASWVNQTYSDYRKISPCGVQQIRVTQNQITSQIIGGTIQSVVGSILGQVKSESSSDAGGSDAAGKNNKSKNNKKTKKDKNNTSGGTNTTNNSGGDGSNNSNGKNQTNSNGSTTSNTTTSSSTNTTTSSSTNTTTNSSSNTTNSGSSSGGNGSNNNGSSQNGAGSGSSSTQNGAGSGSSSTQGNGQGNGQTGEGSNSSTTQTGGQAGGQGSGQAGGQGSGNNTTKTEGSEVVGTTTMTIDANNDRGTGGNGKSKNNPVIISSDLTTAQNLDRSYTGLINVGMSQSSMTGTSSWGANSMIWFNFKQFALTGRYTKIHYSKDRKLKLIHNFNLTGVYSYGNVLGFLGYSAILNTGKWGITGINISAASTKTPDDDNLFMSPSATAFYTKPFRAGKRMILSPELYIISTPLIYSSVDKVTVSDRTFSAFIGTGVDYQVSKRFKVNMNYKLNMSTDPNFPVLSFFLIGSKVNL
jgi:hypothetical protein